MCVLFIQVRGANGVCCCHYRTTVSSIPEYRRSFFLLSVPRDEKYMLKHVKVHTALRTHPRRVDT